ncbi:hydroxyisourate hydrolase-like [Cucumis melo var. makuwa]|uniref:Hydroxyisourate hydrolase-like n=1 Tax=Cucumis melo var. makuwa TaxID=1194695 RepID=A0A5D3DPA6_CUCMM|nr:hydroxyisourate hydrolase-like [Cucumis melo var. makuwa]
MGIDTTIIIGLLPFLFLLISILGGTNGVDNRYDFPSDFIFGSGTTAFQVEGAAKEDGRTPSIWDTFVQSGQQTGDTDVGCNQYHKYKEDVKLMADVGLDAYRFSISWSRLIPNGRGPLNPKGLEYYNNLINELLLHGIQPHVTLHNYDLPQALEDEYEGWISPKIVEDFGAYAEVCFREFGDRVLYWTTVNEPNVFVLGGYDLGFLPPERCSFPFGQNKNCSKGNSTTEPYLALHNILLAHASAANLYKTKYKDKQHGRIGISIYGITLAPSTNSKEDVHVAQIAEQFFYDWVLHPLMVGDYSNLMKKIVGSKLPIFTKDEANLVKGSCDFIGITYYGDMSCKYMSNNWSGEYRDVNADLQAQIGILKGVLEYLMQEFGNPPVIIYENGFETERNSSLQDVARVKYMMEHIQVVFDALRNGSNINGYFTWSFIDVFELLTGYKTSYGLFYVDLDDPNRKRYSKLSAKWYSNFLKGKASTNLDSDAATKLLFYS